jgi:hypothetical protein
MPVVPRVLTGRRLARIERVEIVVLAERQVVERCDVLVRGALPEPDGFDLRKVPQQAEQ